jgi:hypothetical protein
LIRREEPAGLTDTAVLAGEGNNFLGSCWVPGWWDVSPDQAADESAEQGLAAATDVVHELKETEIQR